MWFLFSPQDKNQAAESLSASHWKESHFSASAACFSLAEVCVSGSCSERANQKSQVHFITAHCVCAWRRHVPSITETIWHQHCCLFPNLGISVAFIPYSHCSCSAGKPPLRCAKLTLVINIWRSPDTDKRESLDLFEWYIWCNTAGRNAGTLEMYYIRLDRSVIDREKEERQEGRIERLKWRGDRVGRIAGWQKKWKEGWMREG